MKSGPETLRKLFPDNVEERNKFFNAFLERCTSEKVGMFLSDTFDFPYQATGRTEAELHKLTRRCVDMRLLSFPNIEKELNPVTLGTSFEKHVHAKEVILAGGIQSCWQGHASKQNWDEVFPIEKEHAATVLDKFVDKCRHIQERQRNIPKNIFIDVANECFQSTDIVINVDNFTENIGNYVEVIQEIKDEIPDDGISRNKLKTLFENTFKELGKTQSASLKEKGSHER